jgi:NAD(P)H-flavin reductase/hemoglobin-like flavoprotein
MAMHGDAVPLFFCSDLFLRHPETRDLFPVSMAAQRDRLVLALGRIVSDVSRAHALRGYLQGPGREHRKFGAIAGYYPCVGASLLATLAHFNGPAWTPELATDWKAAYDLVAQVMIGAAAEDARVRPACWEATVIAHELRRSDIATFRVATTEPLHYRPGQSVSMESPERPRIWRCYSPANVPRDDLTMDLHVRMIDGGALSMVLTRGLAVGARLRIGPAAGTLMYEPGTGRDVLLVGGSTGLAPLKAIAEQISGLPGPPRVHLLFGARTADGLYDLTDLEKMAARQPGPPSFRWSPMSPASPVSGACCTRSWRAAGTGGGTTSMQPGRPRWSKRPSPSSWLWVSPGARSISKTLAGVSHDRILPQRPADTRSGAVDHLSPGPVRPPRPR